MKLWHLTPNPALAEKYDRAQNPWEPWYDKNFGFVIRAKNEASARQIAADNASDEGKDAWLKAEFSDCRILTAVGESGVVETNFAAA